MLNESFMQTAVELGARGRGYTKTNPCVGAVVVKNGVIIGRGWHEAYGSAHAEVNALREAGDEAEGADIYVTLEPCTTYGKTPPCSEAIIAAGIKRVFIGVLDPNPKHAGWAVEVFKTAGIEVFWGVHAQACAELIEDFTKHQQTGMPYVTAKIAQSLDGKIATRTGDSKWITSEESRRLVHRFRSENDAVLVGIGTVLADDPELTVREIPVKKQPVRIVLDSKCRLPHTAKLVQGVKNAVAPLIVVSGREADRANAQRLMDAGAQIIYTDSIRVDIAEALKELGKMTIMNILLEGGSTLFGGFLAAGCVDRMQIFVAPLLIGGDTAKGSIGGEGADTLRNAYRLENLECVKSGVDFLFQGKLRDYSTSVLDLTARYKS